MDSSALYEKYNLVDLAEVSVSRGDIVPGMLLRSGSLDSMDAKDWEAINRLHPIGLWVDLRCKDEIPVLPSLYKPENRLVSTACAWANIPLQGLLYLMDENRQTHPRAKDWRNVRKFLWSDPQAHLTWMYRCMLESEDNRTSWRRFFSLALIPHQGGMLWHCAQGVDRAGLTTAFVLNVLGASEQAILDNYEKCMTHSGLNDCKTVALERAIAYLNRTEDGISGYLERKIGLSAELREAFAERFIY